MSSLTRYFGMCFGVLWGGFACVSVYRLSGGDRLRATDALLLFPVGVLGVGAAGVLSSARSEGRGGLQQLKAGLLRWRVDWRWYALVLALPPLSVLAVLATLQALVSARFAPNRFFLGILFGLLPGFAEEVGWTGFATRRMLERESPVTTGLQLGFIWAIWHMPVSDFLSAASPHGRSWLAFFIAFTVALVALRVLMVWLYSRTASVLLAQLLHASSTASLVVLGPPRVSGWGEAAWYALYGGVLWVVVLAIVLVERKGRSSDLAEYEPPR